MKKLSYSLALASATVVGAQLHLALRAPAAALSPAQQQVLRYFEVVQLDDGQGGTVPTIRIKGANLQIVNGLGATNGNPGDPYSVDAGQTNGAGNLIVGYAEQPLGGIADRTGSHNLIVGLGHEYVSFGGTAIGISHKVRAPYASITGGTYNEVSELATSINGGSNNLAGAPFAAVGGGAFNWATGDGAYIGGGFRCLANGSYASVSGGYKSVASGEGSSVNGGDRNSATGDRSTVSGGSVRTSDGFADWRAGSLFEDQ